MRSSALAFLVAACGTPRTVANPSPIVAAPPPQPAHLASVTPPATPARARCDQPDLSKLTTSANVVGAVCDSRTREWLYGVTVIVTHDADPGIVAITDETGLFAFTLPQGAYKLTFYYGDRTQSRDLIVASNESFVVESFEQ
jgi:hypothetical protein